eukprot:TRINITY_DN10804_c0_g1_i1.p1 TRINITY_DN10804_c0_g1~~TRINITY_DN10804_c0_g1_i1.p1  ORF type:complete len:503 (+),score=134.18 TRINITY_DN10804_c0_g1_i1:80-1510(+)
MKGRSSRSPLALILEPTKELANQVYEELSKFTKYLDSPPLTYDLIIGGDKSSKDVNGRAHVIVATPGKLISLLKSNKIDLSETQFFVLDEADSLVNPANDSSDDIRFIYSKFPKQAQRHVQVMLFSATLHSDEVTRISEELTNFPTWVDLKGKDSIPETVDHVVLRINPTDHLDVLQSALGAVKVDGVHSAKIHLIDEMAAGNPEALSLAVKHIKPVLVKKVIDTFKMTQALIFARTRLDCDNLEHFLLSCGDKGGSAPSKGKGPRRNSGAVENPYSCVVIHSSISPRARQENMKAFKEGEVKFLICTDVAARGIDVYGLPYVINVTLPDEKELYVHRVGRVGRADHIGLSISLVSSVPERVWYHVNCKGMKDKCNDSRLTSQGGCTIWYDESALLSQIESRLGDISIPVLDDRDMLQGRQDAQVVYGQLRVEAGAGAAAVTSKHHVEVLKPAVEKLAQLEFAAQESYWRLRKQFV